MKRFVIVFLWLAAVCAMTSVEAAAIDLAPGDLVVADLCNKKLVRVDPVSGTQTLTIFVVSYGFSR